jgi:uncharacterized membrane protein
MDRQGVSPHGHRGVELERLALFSDAVFAIAITLLVLELKVPGSEAVRAAGGLGAALIREIPRFFAFLMSFTVIGSYWILHHRMFRYLQRCDEGLVSLNLVLLLFVAFLPFPVALFSSFRRDPVAIGFYATSVALAGLGLNLLWWYATRRRRLVAPDLDRRILRYVQFRAAVLPIVFTISLPFAFLILNWTVFSMLAMVPLVRFVGVRFERAAREAEHGLPAGVLPAVSAVAPAPAPSPAGPLSGAPLPADPAPGP